MSDTEIPPTTVFSVRSTLTGSNGSALEDFCNSNLQMSSRFWAEPTDQTGEESGLRSLMPHDSGTNMLPVYVTLSRHPFPSRSKAQ